MPDMPALPRDKRQPPRTEAVGRPVAISAFARLLLKMHQQRPVLRLITTEPNDDPRRPVPAKLEG